MLLLYCYLGIVVPILSATAFAMYWHDKQQAIQHGARIPESALLAVGQFGGWPGAWLAQRFLRHKSSKLSFQIKFVATVIGHVLVVTALGVALYVWTH